MLDANDFTNRGYVVVPDLLPPRALQPVRDEYDRLLDQLAGEWRQAGKIANAYPGLDFASRLVRIVNDGEVPYYKAFDISLRFGKISQDDPIHLGPAVFGLLTHPAILSAVEEFIGPEVSASPIQHSRIKLPDRHLPARLRTSLSAKAAWHQDQASGLPEADGTDIVTAWVAVTDATVENGCLMVIPESHHELIVHCSQGTPGRNIFIPEDLLPGEPVSLEVTSGTVIFMHRRLVHGSHVNLSDQLRWSFDFRYQPTGQPTGRPQFPSFVARSARHPESVLTDPRQWARRWLDARARLASAGEDARDYRRWTGAESAC